MAHGSRHREPQPRVPLAGELQRSPTMGTVSGAVPALRRHLAESAADAVSPSSMAASSVAGMRIMLCGQAQDDGVARMLARMQV